MSENQDREPNPNAYTAPVENGEFQFSSRLEPPQPKAPEPPKKHGAAPLIAAVLIILALCSAFFVLILHLRISLQHEGKGFSLALVSRDRSEKLLHPEAPASPEPAELPVLPVQSGGYEWSGARMRISSAGQKDPLSYAQLYSRCAPSVGVLESVSRNGRVKKGAVIVMTEDGALLASAHLVSGADSISVSLNDSSYEAQLIGLDYATDLAVLKIEAENLAAATFCGDDQYLPGEPIAVIGDPALGVVSIRDGILSAVNPSYLYRGFPMEVLQIGMALGDVASGSALVNASGQIIGILDAELGSELPEAEGVFMAISMRSARPVMDELLQNGCVAGRPSSGLTVSELPAAYAAYYGYPSCLYISAVDASSPAADAGLMRGDLILEANGVTVGSVNEIYAVINGMAAGDLLTLTICRDREISEVSFTLMDAARAK
ncbi:MAG: trypsin-like peptidase domain-containing protein [Oscillospiraceae bacterium]|nr:trypsin-like peptidase domain-containing protein [Oscillospiraceae bacterium]